MPVLGEHDGVGRGLELPSVGGVGWLEVDERRAAVDGAVQVGGPAEPKGGAEHLPLSENVARTDLAHELPEALDLGGDLIVGLVLYLESLCNHMIPLVPCCPAVAPFLSIVGGRREVEVEQGRRARLHGSVYSVDVVFVERYVHLSLSTGL